MTGIFGHGALGFMPWLFEVSWSRRMSPYEGIPRVLKT